MFGKKSIVNLEKFFPIVFITAFEGLLYNKVGEISASFGKNYASLVQLNLDLRFPLISWMVVPYVLLWIYPILYVATVMSKTHVNDSRKVYFSAIFLYFFHILIWILFPVNAQDLIFLGREALETENSIYKGILLFVYQISSPWNSLPSAHVSIPWFIYFISRMYTPRFKHVTLFMALLVTVSTMAIKIHFLADAVAGFMVAFLWYEFFHKRMPQSLVNKINAISSKAYILFYFLATVVMIAISLSL